MSEQRLQQQLNFLVEIDQLKQVERQTAITGGSRRENTAEHSWHLAMYALVLQEWSNVDVNIAHVLALCLVHDIVEIDAGDTFAYDTTGYADKDAREQKPPTDFLAYGPTINAIAFDHCGTNTKLKKRPKASLLMRSIACSQRC